MESFESYADGLAMESVPGWSGNPGAANISTDAGLIAKLLSYVASGGFEFPISGDTHDQILCVNPSQTITDCIGSSVDDLLYTDFMWLPGITGTSGSIPEAGTGDQLVMYVVASTRK